MSKEENFWSRMVELSPPMEETKEEVIFQIDDPVAPVSSTSNTELLEKIASLEKMISDLKNENGNNQLQAGTDLSDS